MSVWADTQVRAQLSETAVASPVYNITLHGSANGLLPFTFEVTSRIVPTDGAYSGIAKQVNLKRKTGSVRTLSLLLNDTTKQFLGKEEWYLYLEVKTYADDGTTLLNTETATMRLSQANRVAAADAPTRVVMSGPLEAYAIT